MNPRRYWPVFIALLCVCLAAPETAGAQLFDTRTDYLTDSRPVDLAIGDLDGDGNLDLASANSKGQNVSILLGNGDSTFRPMANVAVGEGASSLAIGDLDGDGSVDLAVAAGTYSAGGYLAVLLGNGDGTFQEAVDYETGDNGYGGGKKVVIEDLDNDGDADLAVATGSYESGYLAVLLGNGDGTFQAYAGYTTGPGCNSLTTGELNGDGYPDLVATNYVGDHFTVLLGNGDGTFGIANYFADVSPYAVAIGDLNGDEVPDLAVMHLWSSVVSAMLGNGDGTFQWALNSPVGTGATSVSAMDLDGDGILDLVSVDGYEVSLLPGNGDGTFQAPVASYFTGDDSSSLVTGDLNGDGRPDLAVANKHSDNVSIFRGIEGGFFREAQRFEAGEHPVSVTVGDLNNDGRLDLALADRHSFGGVTVLLGNGNGTMQPAQQYEAGDYPNSIAMADFNGDGNPDLVVTNQTNYRYSVLLGNGDGSMQPAVTYYNGGTPRSVAVGDLDEDGHIDLAIAGGDSNSVFVRLGRGDGTFSNGGAFGTGDIPIAVTIGDLNGDTIPDLATANQDSDNVSILLGYGDGTFQAAIGYGVSEYPKAMACGDLNGDGAPDLATVSLFGTFSVLLGNGDGTFGASVDYVNGDWPGAIVLHDLDGDGISDLAATCGWDNNVRVFAGIGDGTFHPSVGFGAGEVPISAAVGDFDGDGDPDLAVVNEDSEDVSILLNTRGTISAELTCIPAAGTLPFPSLFQAAMTNTYAGQARRFQYTINVTLGGGQYYSSWRRGWQNIQAGETYTKQWTQTIPNLPSVVGLNFFDLTVADVTPPPYNLPPYPPAGDTDRDSCMVTGVAP